MPFILPGMSNQLKAWFYAWNCLHGRHGDGRVQWPQSKMKATVVVRTFKIGSAAFDKTNGLVKRSQIASVEVNFVFWTDQGAKIERKLQLWLSWVEKKPEWTCRKYSSHVHTRFVEPTKPGLYMLLPIFCSMLTRSGSGNDPKRLLGFHRQPESGTQYLA